MRVRRERGRKRERVVPRKVGQGWKRKTGFPFRLEHPIKHFVIITRSIYLIFPFCSFFWHPKSDNNIVLPDLFPLTLIHIDFRVRGTKVELHKERKNPLLHSRIFSLLSLALRSLARNDKCSTFYFVTSVKCEGEASLTSSIVFSISQFHIAWGW